MSFNIPGRIYNAIVKFCGNDKPGLTHLYYNRVDGTIRATNSFVYLI